MSNCGLKALEQMSTLKNVSMFSLIHLAKDNGISLYFCKVEENELMDVARPAIFHQKNHFVFVSNGEPMPAGEYDGYVLTTKPLHEPLPYSLAKKIRGAKKGGDLLAPIVVGAASFINPLLGAAAGAALGGYQAAGGAGVTAHPGEWWRIPLGGATGYLQGASGGSTLGINNSTLAAGLAAAGEVPGAIKSGNWMAPITAGIGQYMGAKAIGGAQAGSAAGSDLFGKITGGVKGAFNAFTGGGSTPTSGTEVASKAGNLAAGTTPAGYGGSYTIPGVGNNVVGIPGVSGPVGFGSSSYGAGAAGLASGVGATPSIAKGMSSSSGFDIGKMLSSVTGGGGSNIQNLGGLASSLLPAPKATRDLGADYSKAAQYIGGDNWQQLPAATRQQLEEYTNASIEDLTTKFTQGNDKALNDLDAKKQQAVDQLMTQYANYGQDPYTSTDAQQRLTEINRQYDQAKSEVQQQIQNQAQQQAIDFKKDILQKSMTQGQFDNQSFMQLAQLYGMDQEAHDALANKDYAALQAVLGKIFSAQGGK